MEKSKKVQKNGSISIPKDMRAEMGISAGMAVDIKSDGETIIITPHAPVCRFCGEISDILCVSSMQLHICRSCAEKIIKEAKE